MFFSTIFGEDGSGGSRFEFFFLVEELSVEKVRSGRVRVDMDVVAALFGLPREELEFLNFDRAA
jgi:hypothetical protein